MGDVCVAFLWHMHQPVYRNPRTGDFILPFVRLHAVKGYYDMVCLAREYPEIRMTVNLVPSLIEQILQYGGGNERTCRDYFSDLSLRDPKDLTPDERLFIIRHFFMNRWDTHIYPYPRYRELLMMRGSDPNREDPDLLLSRFSDDDIGDLQALFNLTWCGYSVKKNFPEIAALLKKGKGFSREDKTLIIDTHTSVLTQLLSLYRKAFDEGIMELSTSPFYHPILPLLIDTDCARRAMPAVVLPRRFLRPDDARDQVVRGISLFTETFGHHPRGMWPPEGAVSPEIIPILGQSAIRWMASDEGILDASRVGGGEPKDLYSPYRVTYGDHELSIVFRDRKLSDLIGFSYSQNEPENAAADFIRHAKNISATQGKTPALISVILDGENPWEGYRDGGEGFLRRVYEFLIKDNEIRSTSIGDFIDRFPPRRTIEQLHSGSWIDKNYRVWIGHPEDNQAWDCLGITRDFFARQDASVVSEEKRERARKFLFAAEGSDWFWWFGEDFHTDIEEYFDALFREHLTGVFLTMGADPPNFLSQPIKVGKRAFETRMPVGFIEPNINGVIDDYYEWINAGCYEVGHAYGSMYGGPIVIREVYFGFSSDSFFVRLDPADEKVFSEDITAHVFFEGEARHRAVFRLRKGEHSYTLAVPTGNDSYETIGDVKRVGIARIVELGLSFSDLGLSEGRPFCFYVELKSDGVTLFRCPHRGSLEMVVPDVNFERDNWSA